MIGALLSNEGRRVRPAELGRAAHMSPTGCRQGLTLSGRGRDQSDLMLIELQPLKTVQRMPSQPRSVIMPVQNSRREPERRRPEFASGPIELVEARPQPVRQAGCCL